MIRARLKAVLEVLRRRRHQRRTDGHSRAERREDAWYALADFEARNRQSQGDPYTAEPKSRRP